MVEALQDVSILGGNMPRFQFLYNGAFYLRVSTTVGAFAHNYYRSTVRSGLLKSHKYADTFVGIFFDEEPFDCRDLDFTAAQSVQVPSQVRLRRLLYREADLLNISNSQSLWDYEPESIAGWLKEEKRSRQYDEEDQLASVTLRLPSDLEKERLNALILDYRIPVDTRRFSTAGLRQAVPSSRNATSISGKDSVIMLHAPDYRKCLQRKIDSVKAFKRCFETYSDCEECREDISFTGLLVSEFYSLLGRMSADGNQFTRENFLLAKRYMERLDLLCYACPQCDEEERIHTLFFRGVEKRVQNG